MNRVQKISIFAILALLLGGAAGFAAPPLRTQAAGSIARSQATQCPADQTRIDVGFTIRSGSLIKGSGSYTNCSGAITQVCIRLQRYPPGGGFIIETSRCVPAPAGTNLAFSAPDAQCKPGTWETEVLPTTTDGSLSPKFSNQIRVSQC